MKLIDVNKSFKERKSNEKELDLYTTDNSSTILHKQNFLFHGFPSLHINLAYQFNYLTFLNNRMNVENSLVTSCKDRLQEHKIMMTRGIKILNVL